MTTPNSRADWTHPPGPGLPIPPSPSAPTACGFCAGQGCGACAQTGITARPSRARRPAGGYRNTRPAEVAPDDLTAMPPDPPPSDRQGIIDAGGVIDHWADMGILDRSWAVIFKAALRRPTDDTYDPDYRAGIAITADHDNKAEDRADIARLLEMTVGPDVFYGNDCELSGEQKELRQSIADRIGWKL